MIKDKIEQVGNGFKRVSRDLVFKLYDKTGDLPGVGVQPEVRPYYQQAVRETPQLAYMAVGLDVADLVPVVSQASMAGDVALYKMVGDYVRAETGNYRPPRLIHLLMLACEGLAALIPGLPAEVIPTAVPLTVDGYRQVAVHRYVNYRDRSQLDSG